MRNAPGCIRLALLSLLAAMAAPAAAATYTVTRFDDPAPNGCLPADCSLREAVIAANFTPAHDDVLLSAGTYAITQDNALADELQRDLDVSAPLTIQGAGSNLTTIRMAIVVSPSASDHRILESRYTTLAIEGVTLRDGNAQNPFFGTPGGCIYAFATQLRLGDVRLTNCTASAGGGLSLAASHADMKAVSIDGNHAKAVGGGLELRGSTTAGDAVSVQGNDALGSGGGVLVSGIVAYRASRIAWSVGSVVADNRAGGAGGGIFVNSGTELIVEPAADATPGSGELLAIRGNSAVQDGGGIAVAGIVGALPPGLLSATRLSLSGNRSDQSGGGLFTGGRIQLSDSEFVSNSAQLDGGGAAVGGDARQSRIEGSSFARNVATRYGGAVATLVDSVALVNVSSYSNSAQSGGAFSAGGFTEFMQTTSFADSAVTGGSLRTTAVANSRSSVWSNGCTLVGAGGAIADFGGSAQASGMTACAGTTYTPAQMGLKYGYYGGRFRIVGFTSAASVLHDSVPSTTYVHLRDARNYVRALPADAGAYEFDGVP